MNRILSDRISRAIVFTKQKHFEFGDKPHKLLARQLRKLENDRAIHKINSETGLTLTSHKEFNDRFMQFYKNLYASKPNASPDAVQSFLDKCDLPSLSETERKILNADISCEEL